MKRPSDTVQEKLTPECAQIKALCLILPGSLVSASHNSAEYPEMASLVHCSSRTKQALANKLFNLLLIPT